MYKKNELLQMTITDLTNDGEGVGRTGTFIWFVKDTVPGDTIEASVMKVKKTYGYARLQKVIKPGDGRCLEKCEKARACGGCSLQNMTYETQLKFKANKVRNNLIRIGGFGADFIDGIFGEIIGMEDPWRYRNKAQVPLGIDKCGKVKAGFYAAHSHDIIDHEDCLLGTKENAVIIKTVKENYDPSMRHVLIRKGFSTGQIMVCIISSKRLELEELSKKLVGTCKDITTVVNNVNALDTNVILGDKTYIVYGPGYIEDYIGNLKFRISAESFFQVNPVQVEKLYGKAVEFAGLKGTETVWDLYCGIGTITLSMALKAGKVYGIEIVERAIIDAKENAKLNGIDNAFFYAGKAEDTEITDTFERPDVIVVDPPRKGCDSVCLSTMLRQKPQRIVYVSCDSATLARDLKILCDGGYELKKVQPVDMFPWTGHVECVVLLTKHI